MDKRGSEDGKRLKMTGSEESGGNRIGGGGGTPSHTPKNPKPPKPAPVKPPRKGTKPSKGA